MFLLVAGTMFIFTACNCGTCSTDCAKECCTASSCVDDCQKACCLGCKATDGEKGCELLATKYKKHSCCSKEGVTLVEPKPHTHDDSVPHSH